MPWRHAAIWRLELVDGVEGPMTLADLWNRIDRLLGAADDRGYLFFVIRLDTVHVWPFSVTRDGWDDFAPTPAHLARILALPPEAVPADPSPI